MLSKSLRYPEIERIAAGTTNKLVVKNMFNHSQGLLLIGVFSHKTELKTGNEVDVVAHHSDSEQLFLRFSGFWGNSGFLSEFGIRITTTFFQRVDKDWVFGIAFVML